MTAETPDDVSFALNDIQHAYWIGRQGGFELGDVGTHLFFEFAGRLEPDRLQQSFDRLFQHHDMLRAQLTPGGRLTINQGGSYRIVVIDHRELLETASAQRLSHARARMVSFAPDLRSWPHFAIELHLLPDATTRLLLNLDMIIVDAFSVRLLLETWGRFYLDLNGGPPRPGISFVEYLAKEREFSKSPAYLKARDYWQNRLSDLPPAPKLPARRQRSQRAPYEHKAFSMTAPDWAALKKRAAQRGLTAPAVVGQAFTEVLGAWSEAPRFCINVTLNRRLPVHPDISAVVGTFTSTVLLAVDLTEAATFAGRAERLAARLWQDMENVYYGGVEVLRDLSRSRRAPVLMPVVFTAALGDLHQVSSWAGRLVEVASETSQVSIDGRLTEYDGALQVGWDLASNSLPPGVADEMFTAYSELLVTLARDEKAWDASPDLLPEPHRRLHAEANSTATGVSGLLMHQLVENRLKDDALRPAVITAERTLSYAELIFRARHLALTLRAQGARPNELIAVLMEKGWEEAVAVLAIQMSGAAYLPIDPALPAERIALLLREGRVRQLVTQPRVRSSHALSPELAVHVVAVGDRQDQIDALPVAQTHTDLAYVIFTSGSTGVPKGVMIDHRGAVNTIVDINARFQLSPSDRVFGISALSFDLSVWDIFGPLAVGAAVVLPEPQSLRDPARWNVLTREHGVTVWNSAPALLEIFVHHLEESADGALAPRLRLVMLSGDWIPTVLPGRARALFGAPRVISLGGATEASIWSVWYDIGAVPPDWVSIPYGKALANQTMWVLDETLRDRPTLVAGEIYLGGLGLAQGYWADPKRTAERFVNDPKTGERLYRTGDWGRWLPDGNVEFLGRQDSQIKLRGHRIELGEIQVSLERHPAVSQCCVLYRQPRTRAQRAAESAFSPGADELSPEGAKLGFLVAYAALRPEVGATEDELREYLRENLPSYMVPMRVVIVAAIPLSSNGKVDRRALPDPDLALPPSRGESALSSSELQVRALWSDALGLEASRIGPDDNFFDLGGNSLLVISLSVAFAQLFKTTVRPTELFEHTTIRQLAQRFAGEAAPSAPEQGAAEAPAASSQKERLAALRHRRSTDRQGKAAAQATPALEPLARSNAVERREHRARPGQLVDAFLETLSVDGGGNDASRSYAPPSGSPLVEVMLCLDAESSATVARAPGLYRYDPIRHGLVALDGAFRLERQVHSPLNQRLAREALLTVLLCSSAETVQPVGEKARLAHLEAGLIAGLLASRATELGLRAVHIGLFDRERLNSSGSFGQGVKVVHVMLLTQDGD